MDYQFENLGPEKFQEFCQALLARQFPKLQCFPVGQRDGGRDALAYFMEDRTDGFIVFQVKYVRKPLAEVAPHKWLLSVIEDEKAKVQKLIPKGAKEYYLLTNVPGTSYLEGGSIDSAHVALRKATNIPSQCWWREDLVAKLDNAFDLKWVYPELLTGRDILRYVVETGLTEDKERRTSAIRAFVRDQYSAEETVRFKQVELQNKLLDLFVDVPITLREGHTDRRRRNDFHLTVSVFHRIAAEAQARKQSEANESSDVGAQTRGEEWLVGAATLLLHSKIQQHVRYLVLEGAPGQGKSTITQYVCQVHRMRLLDEIAGLTELPKHHASGPVRLPIRVDLRDLATWLAKQDPFQIDDQAIVPEGWFKSLEAFLAALIRHHAGGVGFDVGDLHAVAKTSAMLVVLDGLDEVADFQRRKDVVDEVVKGVNRLATIAVSLQVVVTSRPAAFANSPGMPGTLFQYCELGSLSRELIRDYAGKWLRARKLQGREAADVNRILKEKLDQPHLRDLARNPMQLAILLSLIHTRGASLPDKRTALYDNYVELFFNRESEKSTVVREYRELLIDIHRYLAWVLHSESELGRSRGSVSADELRRMVITYLKEEGHAVELADKLFHGMVERVVALVSRVEGTYEFEVQPLREYFAARYLYETAPYSPTGAEQGGTLPDRLDAMARNLFWLNVTRFYSGCFNKGELPSLVDRLEELVKAPNFSLTSYPRVLAATLLSDWVFTQHPKSMRKVVTLILDSLGLRRFVAASGGRRSNPPPLILPKGCGNEELVDHCFTLLQSNPSRDFALSVIELLNANTSVADRSDRWIVFAQNTAKSERTRWLEYGLWMQIIATLPPEVLELLLSDSPNDVKRLRILVRIPHLGVWEKAEDKFRFVLTAVLDGNVGVSTQRKTRYLTQLIAQAHSVSRYGIAFRIRQPGPLSALWGERSFTMLPSLEEDEIIDAPTHKAALDCKTLLQEIRHQADEPVSDWSGSLSPWDKCIELSRGLFGERWAHRKLACVAGGIKAVGERCNDAVDLLDQSQSLCRRTRYARLRAGQPTWWEKQLDLQTSEDDASFALLVLLTWGSSNTLVTLAPKIGAKLETLSVAIWNRLWVSLGECQEAIRSEADLGINPSTIPARGCSHRFVTALGERVDGPTAMHLYKMHLADFSGTDPAVLHFAQSQAVRSLFEPGEPSEQHLRIIRLSYSRGVSSDFGTELQRRRDSVSELDQEAARIVASNPDQYPMDLVGFAEGICKNQLASHIVPVGQIATRDKWFGS